MIRCRDLLAVQPSSLRLSPYGRDRYDAPAFLAVCLQCQLRGKFAANLVKISFCENYGSDRVFGRGVLLASDYPGVTALRFESNAEYNHFQVCGVFLPNRPSFPFRRLRTQPGGAANAE